MILAGHNVQQTLELAERLREEVAALTIEHHRSKVDNYVTISVEGYALCPHEPVASEELIHYADGCRLYQAKAAGRNRAIVNGGCS